MQESIKNTQKRVKVGIKALEGLE